VLKTIEAGSRSHRNINSQKRYSGINPLILSPPPLKGEEIVAKTFLKIASCCAEN
jgi:hypothetical protein